MNSVVNKPLTFLPSKSFLEDVCLEVVEVRKRGGCRIRVGSVVRGTTVTANKAVILLDEVYVTPEFMLYDLIWNKSVRFNF